jgi:hypothetical protein
MMSRVERINGAVNAASDVFTHFMAVWGIPCADGAVAILAARNMAVTLGFPLGVAILTGFALEGVGIAAGKAALECHYYNQIRGNRPPVLERLAWVVAGVQFSVGFALILVNAVMVERMVLGLLAIGVLSTTGTLAHMLRDDVRARSHSADALPSPERVAEVIADLAPVAARPTKRQQLAAHFSENPHDTNANAARECGIPAATVRVWRQQLVEEGAIPHNGDGGR